MEESVNFGNRIDDGPTNVAEQVEQTEYQLMELVRAKMKELFVEIDKFKKDLLGECSDLILKQIDVFDTMLEKQPPQPLSSDCACQEDSN